jgi:hypothetical protein
MSEKKRGEGGVLGVFICASFHVEGARVRAESVMDGQGGVGLRRGDIQGRRRY